MAFLQPKFANNAKCIEGKKHPLDLKYGYRNNAERLMAVARYAHECTDITTLELILGDLQNLWQSHLKSRAGGIDAQITTLVKHSAVHALYPSTPE